MKKLLLISILVVLSAEARTYYNESRDTREIGWMDKGKLAAKSRLKDPYSAKFKDIFFSISGGVPMTCGEVNAKNSFGAYGGYQRFASAGKPELTFLENDVDNFSAVWNKFCQ